MRWLFFFSFMLLSLSSYAATILIHGDSLSAGYGIKSGDEWASLLQKNYPKHNIINSSLSGETTLGGLKRLPDLLEKYRPNILILELGANDGLRGQDLTLMQKNLQTMIQLGNQYGKVLLLGVRIPPNYGKRYSDAFHQVYENLAKKNAIAYVPFFLLDIAGNADLMQKDGLHPNEKAQSLILKNVNKSLTSLLQDKP